MASRSFIRKIQDYFKYEQLGIETQTVHEVIEVLKQKVTRDIREILCGCGRALVCKFV